MRILSIGQEIDHPDVTNEYYNSLSSFLDYDVVIIDPTRIFYEYETAYTEEYQGCRNLSDNDSPKIIEDIKRRNSEIQELLKIGRIVIIMIPSPEKCYYCNGYSNIGKTSRRERNVVELGLTNTIPVKNLNLVPAEGVNIEFRGKAHFKSFFENVKDLLYYSAYLSEPIGEPFLFIRGTDMAIASWIPTDNGILLLLPIVNFNEISSVKKSKIFSKKFLNALDELVSVLKNDFGDYVRPIWEKKFHLPNEKVLLDELVLAEDSLQKVIVERDSVKVKIAELEQYKILLYGQGIPLQKQVGRIFEEIGFDVQQGTGNRVDLIIHYNDNVAVVEVKGTTKSAAEKNSRQLEQWISEYCVANEGSDCKGILVINAFCDLPLDARTNRQEFPDTMVKVSSERKHCLMTTTQLLGLYYAIMANPDNRDIYLTELLNTVGIYPNFKDYSGFIEPVSNSS